jgi:hypothetical protein
MPIIIYFIGSRLLPLFSWMCSLEKIVLPASIKSKVFGIINAIFLMLTILIPPIYDQPTSFDC